MNIQFDPLIYKEKLKEFNSSEKYWKEVHLLDKLLNIGDSEIILDFGCGIGTVMDFFITRYNASVLGFDVYDYTNGLKDKVFTDLDTLTSSGSSFNKIYFFHSFAHIKQIADVLSKLKLILSKDSELVIITPNLDFDNFFKSKIKESTYRPDTTVVEHYNCEKLHNLMALNGFQTVNIGQFGKFLPGEPFNERIFGIFKVIEK
ncbi:MAG: methyltransferase domain-containing protein [Ignavibacteria bacterium]|nr:methyltransferase domain-containing protein [Ignavibacteria bacterium]